MKVAREKFSMRFSRQNLNLDIFLSADKLFRVQQPLIIVHPGNFLSIFVFFQGEWLAAIIKREIYIINSFGKTKFIW